MASRSCNAPPTWAGTIRTAGIWLVSLATSCPPPTTPGNRAESAPFPDTSRVPDALLSAPARRTERVGILPFLKQDDWGVMVGVGIDQGFFYYFFRARRDHTETGQWTRLAAPHHATPNPAW